MEIRNPALQFIINFDMGTQCVRLSPKPHHLSYKTHKGSSSLRTSQEVLQFQIAISNLELHCTLNNFSQVIFRVKGCFQLTFDRCDFSIHEKIIKCSGVRQSVFEVNAKDIEHLNFQTLIRDSRGSILEKFALKMHAVCEGPKNHDHLLKQMKSRIMFNLDISQMVLVDLFCNSFEVKNYDHDQQHLDYAYSIVLKGSNEENQDTEQKILTLEDGEQIQKNLKKVLPTNKLKQSIIGITLYKKEKTDHGDEYEEVIHMHFPYMKLSRSDDACLITDHSGKSIDKRKTTYCEQIKHGPKVLGEVEVEVICFTSKIYLEQMDCFVYSQDGVKIMSPLQIPTDICESTERISKKDIEFFIRELNSHRKVSYSNKSSVQKSLKICEFYLKKPEISEICRLEDMINIQISFVDLLEVLGGLITEGEDITNEKIWEIIDIIIHRPELSSKCLYLIESKQNKEEIGIKYYSFLCTIISKIVMCTTVGLEYRELKCIQKFIAYAYFRYPWIQKVLINAIKRQNDQILTDEKLMEIGAYPGCRSPAKNILYDWQQCLYNDIKKLPKYKDNFNEMMDIVGDVPHWAQIIFNREDDELFYGLLIQLWNQAETYLYCHGKVLWQYFPYYGELLGAVLGQMQSNQIIQYSPTFMQCSIRLMSNQKLLNIFVKFLFQKTHLYKIYYVVKALQIIRLYFQAISKLNKLIPKQFNFNYFYTGITSIFESNHSILLIKVLTLLYDYYHIFSQDFKKMLDRFIFKRSFYQMFLHWCGYVRKIFYYFLEHRVAVKFRLHHKNLSINESCLGYQSIEIMHIYENLIYSLEQEYKLLKQNSKESDKLVKSSYHLKMKEKLNKKAKIKISTEEFHLNPQSKHTVSHIHLREPSTPEPMNRHKKSFLDFEVMSEMKMNRKYSVGNELIEDSKGSWISDNNRKYIEMGMREYKQIKGCSNPDKSMREILQKYQGSKQTQIS